jgi:hypothetical protein
METKTFDGFMERIRALPLLPGNAAPLGQRVGAPMSVTAPPTVPTHFTITLKPMRGEAQTVKVPVTEKVGALRVRAAELFAIGEVERVRLIRSGKALMADEAMLSEVVGLGSGSAVTLHVLEKPVVAASVPLVDVSHPIWGKIDALLMESGGVGDVSVRRDYISRFQAALK